MTFSYTILRPMSLHLWIHCRYKVIFVPLTIIFDKNNNTIHICGKYCKKKKKSLQVIIKSQKIVLPLWSNYLWP